MSMGACEWRQDIQCLFVAERLLAEDILST